MRRHALELGPTYQEDTRQGEIYDSITELKSEVFKEKFQFMQRFLAREDSDLVIFYHQFNINSLREYFYIF